MDWEAPADAWYVWVAVAIVSIALTGLVLGLPTGPPPDANQAANTIDRVTGSTEDATGSYEHDAERVKIDGATIAMRNDDGTDRATLRRGAVVPVQNETRLHNLTRGVSFEDEYADEHREVRDFDIERNRVVIISGTESRPAVERLLAETDEVYERNTGEWYTADGTLTARTVSVDAYWFDQWATEDPDGIYLEAEMTDEDGFLSDRPAEVTVSYGVSEEQPMSVQFFDDEGDEFDSVLQTVDGTGTITLEIDDTVNLESYPVSVTAAVGSESGSESLEHGDDSAVVIDHAEYPTNDVVAANFDWLNYDSETGEYYVTYVIA